MLTLLLGPDDFSKKEYITILAAKEKAQTQFFFDSESLGSLQVLTDQDLFSKPKVFVLSGIFSKLDFEQNLERLIKTPNKIFIVEEKLDKRSKFNKGLLSNKNVTSKEFQLPHGKELDKWILARISSLGGKISASAADLLAKKLGRDEAQETKFGGKVVEVKEIFNLFQVNSEIEKLIQLSGGKEIMEEDVENMVSENIEVDALDIANAIGDGDKNKAINLVQNFLKAQTGSEEKTGVIQLNALLAEQFRNVAIVQDFQNRSTSDSEILEKTSWKSGRLFVMKKIAAKFNQKKVLDFLNKLSALDEELKSSSTPPKVLLDLILAQLL
jgi:DNA polymerase III delta subunit